MFFYIRVSSKDKRVLKKFALFLSKIETSTFTLKHFSKQKKRKFITILKSPHVNKTAQEQFEFRIYKKQFLINSFKPLTFLYFLKKIKNLSFSGLNLEIRSLVNGDKKNVHFLKLTNPDNVSLTSNASAVSQDLFLTKYIQLFDCYGEIFLKDIVHYNKL